MGDGPISSGDTTFPPDRRLHTRKEFDLVFREGRKTVRPSFILYYRFREDVAAPSRIGFAISRKVGKSHERNIIKRRLRELFRLHQSLFLAPVELVIVGRPGTHRTPFATLKSEFLDALRSAHVLPKIAPPSA